MSFTITKGHSPNQDNRAAGSKITSITIHWWGIDGQKFDNVVRFLCTDWRLRSDKRKSSAHYVVEDGRITEIVPPAKRAWHAGTLPGNNSSIGIELRPEATDGDYATAAWLIQHLRATYGNLPLKAHKEWKATACPGRWDLNRLDALAKGAVTPVEKPAAPAPAPAAPKPSTPATTGVLKVGSKGQAVKDWQTFLRATFPSYKNVAAVKKASGGKAVLIVVDGSFGAISAAWTVEFQKRTNLVPDGVVGPKTIAEARKHGFKG